MRRLPGRHTLIKVWYSTVQWGVGLSFLLLCHKNDNEAVVCNTEQRQYKESVEACCDSFRLILRWFYGFP